MTKLDMIIEYDGLFTYVYISIFEYLCLLNNDF